MLLKIIAIIMLVHTCSAADILVGSWDFINESKDLKVAAKRALILEGAPENTRIEFDGKNFSHYRNDHIVYVMPYVVKSQKSEFVDVEVGPPGTSYVVKVYVKDGILQANVMGLNDAEYVYRKRG